jgi:DNA-binding NtrC family response regulator
MYTILVFDSCQDNNRAIETALGENIDLTFRTSPKGFQDEIDARQYDLVMVGIDGSNGSSMDALDYTHKKTPYTPIIITSRTEKAEIIVNAMQKGASDFLVHPVSEARITLAIKRAVEAREQRFEIDYLRRNQDVIYDFADLIALSPQMKEIITSLKKFSRTDSTILITGATGTGKSFLSGTVHFNSPRKKKPFVKINCANIPEDLLESELFGHEKGAFTGADKQRIGRFEQANGGTIFLDEIGEISIGLQTKLLRVLEEKSFERVGGNKTIHADVRVIAATNKDLVQQIKQGQFREDLYYRINVLPIRLPSLKDRTQCLLPLVEVLLKKTCRSMGSNVKGFTPEAVASIQAYDWPGNIRQLANTIERAVILEEGELIRAENLSLPHFHPRDVVSVQKPASVTEATVNSTVTETPSLADQEKDLILRILEECLWVQKNAAKKLGISPRALNYKIKKLGITHPHWRQNK